MLSDSVPHVLRLLRGIAELNAAAEVSEKANLLLRLQLRAVDVATPAIWSPPCVLRMHRCRFYAGCVVLGPYDTPAAVFGGSQRCWWSLFVLTPTKIRRFVLILMYVRSKWWPSVFSARLLECVFGRQRARFWFRCCRSLHGGLASPPES